jgi:hypothetical protein
MNFISAYPLAPGAVCPILLATGGAQAQVDTGQMLVWLLVAGGTIGGVCVALVVVNRIVRATRGYSHPGLFSDLCKLHALDRGARRLLKQVAQFHDLTAPARVFTEPGWLNPASLGTQFASQTAALVKVWNLLFGSQEPNPKLAKGPAKRARPKTDPK